MNRGQLLTIQLHDIKWGALDHAFREPQYIGGDVKPSQGINNISVT